MFFFNPLNLEMTGVTIITSSADIRGPLVTVCTLLVSRIYSIGSKILVHGLVKFVGFMKINYGYLQGRGTTEIYIILNKVCHRICGQGMS